LEFLIGIHRTQTELYSLMRNRLSPEALERMSVRPLPDGRVEVHCPGQEEVLLLANVLGDILIEFLQIRYLSDVLFAEYSFAEEEDRTHILIDTLKQLWYGEKEPLGMGKEEAARGIYRCLMEEGPHFSLDGYLHFRMGPRLKQWRQVLLKVAEERLGKNDSMEFIALLRHFLSLREPLLDSLVVIWKNGSYELLDPAGHQLCILMDKDPDCTEEEQLISLLISLAPSHIDLHRVGDKGLRHLLEQIFEGRLVT